jgi:hypothetical protein
MVFRYYSGLVILALILALIAVKIYGCGHDVYRESFDHPVFAVPQK